MSLTHVENCPDFFRLLLTTTYEQQKALVTSATGAQVKGISEIFYNLLTNHDLEISRQDKNLLDSRKHVLKKFIIGKRTILFRKRLLNRHLRVCLDSILILKTTILQLFG